MNLENKLITNCFYLNPKEAKYINCILPDSYSLLYKESPNIYQKYTGKKHKRLKSRSEKKKKSKKKNWED